jgi:DNA-directed RNA polymerase II subunit RPB4
MASSAPKARVKEQPLGDEEASSVLKLGEFKGVHALTLSEARLVINIVQETRKAKQQKEVKESE